MAFLTGWQSIADYLGVRSTTAQKYHRQYGLPVARSVGRRVRTTTGAIDRWIIELDRVERELRESDATFRPAPRLRKPKAQTNEHTVG